MAVAGPEDFHLIPYAIIAAITMAMLFALFLYSRDPARRKPFLVTAVFMALQIAGFSTLTDPETRSVLFATYAQLSTRLTVGLGFTLGLLVAWIGWRYPSHHRPALKARVA